MKSAATNQTVKIRDALLLLLLTLGAVAVHGYHYGVQDQLVYVPAIKQHLVPALYPSNAGYFLVPARIMLFDELVAFTIRPSGLPTDWAVFLWQLFSIYLLLCGCRQVSRRCFRGSGAQWAATSSVAAMLTLQVSGTFIFLADDYLHPRTLAAAAVLFALAAVLDRKIWPALAWLLAGAAMHPTMAGFGAFHLAFLAWPWRPQWSAADRTAGLEAIAALLALPLLGGGNDAWRESLPTRWFLFPLQWPWYAWLGVVVPVALLLCFARLEKEGSGPIAFISRRLVCSGLAGVGIGIVISITPGLERLIPTEPMRTLHLFTLMTVLLGGGILGQRFLKNRPGRWALVFVPVSVAMIVSQSLALYPGSPHIEWPGRIARNDWTEAFGWVRQNTPEDAYFVLGPRYQEIPGEDFHDFRSLAERSSMADYSKDRSVVANWPQLAPSWREQVQDRENWQHFSAADFARLKEKYGVSWTVLEASQRDAGLDCPYHNAAVRVCRIP